MALEPLEKRRGSGSRESGGGCSLHCGLSVPNTSGRKRYGPFEPFEKRRGFEIRESGGVYSRHRRLSVPNKSGRKRYEPFAPFVMERIFIHALHRHRLSGIPVRSEGPYEKGRRSLAAARFCVPAFAQSVFEKGKIRNYKGISRQFSRRIRRLRGAKSRVRSAIMAQKALKLH